MPVILKQPAVGKGAGPGKFREQRLGKLALAWYHSRDELWEGLQLLFGDRLPPAKKARLVFLDEDMGPVLLTSDVPWRLFRAVVEQLYIMYID